MRAVVAQGYGSPAVFQLQKLPIPQPKENEVLVQVYASTATKADTMMRTGKPYLGRLVIGIQKPKHPIPGTGFAGVVVALGSAVKTFKIGDAVCGETTIGFSANAEYVCVAESGVMVKKPDTLDFEEAATLTDGHLTSYNFLKEIGKLQAGQHILINGASGSLGTAAVQLARYFGAEVTAVCSTRNVGLVRSLGANHIIDYTKQDFRVSAAKYDLVYDAVGKSSFGACKRILTPQGQYLSPVLQFPLLIQMLWTSFGSTRKARFAATGLRNDEDLRLMLGEVVELVKHGYLKSVIDRQYPLEKLAEAHTYVDAGHKKGNVVITINTK
jgi:NADPH:quinone reductase-like Zn-dependent oxidoreductase